MSEGPANGEGIGGKNQQWRNPSATYQQKYSLQPLPEDFEPTPEEESLLQFYETIRSYERTAGRLKDAAARARLAAREAEFQQKQNETEGKKKRKRKKSKPVDDDEMPGDSDDDSFGSASEDDSEEEDAQKSSFDKREEKLQALRDEVEAKKASAKNAEADKEELRQELLTRNTSMGDEGPMLKRKKVEQTAEKSSLIASIAAQVTPPHDFSKKLELSPINGRILFPTSTEETDWEPSPEASSPDDGALTLELNSFDVSQAQNGIGNNTVAIKFMAPEKSKRFSINIAGPDHDNFHSVLFHFNPRHFERGGQLVLNNKKEGMWGQAINVPLSTIPIIFGQTSCTLIIQVNGEGFDTFLNDKHIARLEHRRELASGSNSLFLNFPATDDYNKPESWTVYKVWWGNKPTMAKGDLSGVPGYKSFNSVHPRKLFLSKLSKVRTEPEVDLRRAELERAFRKYGGARGVNVSVQKHSTFAFVEFESERQADVALQEMAGHYRINRARRTRHEALQEERAASEAAKMGKKKESVDWD